MRHFQFDPYAIRSRERCTVAALRAEASDVDTVTRVGRPPDESDRDYFQQLRVPRPKPPADTRRVGRCGSAGGGPVRSGSDELIAHGRAPVGPHPGRPAGRTGFSIRAGQSSEGVSVSAPERSTRPARAPVRRPSDTTGVPLTSTCSIPSAPAYSRPPRRAGRSAWPPRGCGRRRIEHDEVSPPALGHATTVGQAVEAGLDVGDQMDGLLQAQHLVLADGVLQEVGA